MVYFALDQSILTTDTQAVVQAAASYAQQGGATRIAVVGHTDTSGSAPYNVRTPRQDGGRRVGRPRRQPDGLQVDWKGESDPAVDTGDGVEEPLHRRATIDINFGS